jgi:DNA polymerase theta
VSCAGSRSLGPLCDVNIAVCTIEKANGILNRLLEERSSSGIELLVAVVDEFHLIGDASRGYLLELFLTKAKHCFPCAQLIGMSATLPNMAMLSTWLNATYYCTGFRPVPLAEHVVFGAAVLNASFQRVRDLFVPAAPGLSVADGVLDQLCLEAVQEHHGVVIFLPRKRWCETLARRLASTPEIRSVLMHTAEACAALVGELRSFMCVDKSLLHVAAHGVAFHHAGLTADERAVIESGFRSGTIRILCATTTLSSGVNLPARRVIVQCASARDWDALTYRQMIGRAGRFGKDVCGESFLVCARDDLKETARRLVAGELREAHSALLSVETTPGLPSVGSHHGHAVAATGAAALPAARTGGAVSPAPALEANAVATLERKTGLQRAVLEIIVGGVARSTTAIFDYLKGTLLFAEAPARLTTAIISDTLVYLREKEFICEREGVLLPTRLGRATVAANLSPAEARVVHDDINNARASLCLKSELHLVYLVTPIFQLGQPDWFVF